MEQSQKVSGVIGGAVVLAAAALFSVFAFAPLLSPEPAATVGTVTVGTVEPGGFTTPTPEPIVTLAPIVEAPVIEAPAPVVETPAGPTLCPDGWFPNSVDGEGNESNCAEGQDGQPCIAYGENNECTAYYKP